MRGVAGHEMVALNNNTPQLLLMVTGSGKNQPKSLLLPHPITKMVGTKWFPASRFVPYMAPICASENGPCWAVDQLHILLDQPT